MFDIVEKTIEELLLAQEKSIVSAKDITLLYMKRIAEQDIGENGLNSVLEINPEAISIAEQLDNERANGRIKPLHGIPVLLKDNINTGDKMHTSAGSLALKDHYAPCDAGVTDRLRKAGAVILGKTNMTEFANFMTNGMPSGYSSRGGQVVSPYNRNENPSGSSSGSGVAASASLCAAAIGTETGGSIIGPAQNNGLVGLKPTVGAISGEGIVPISISQDTAGPMTRTVDDSIRVMDIIANASCPRYSGISLTSLEGVRIGVNIFDADKASGEWVEAGYALIAALEKDGAEIVENLSIASVSLSGKLMFAEFKACMNAYLARYANGCVKTLADIIRFNEDNADTCLKYGQSVLIECESLSGRMTEKEYIDIMLERDLQQRYIKAMFELNRLDVIISVSGYCNAAPFTGIPSLSIPAGMGKNGVPIGSYWMARPYDDFKLLKIAKRAETIFNMRKRPPID